MIDATPAPPPGLLVTGYFRETEGYAVQRPQGSRNWLLTYTIAGEGRFRQGNATLAARPGDIVLLTPHAAHDYAATTKGWDFYWCHFLPRPAWSAWLHVPPSASDVLHLTLPTAQVRSRVFQQFQTVHADVYQSAIDPFMDEWGYAAHTLPHLNLLQQELALGGIEQILILAMQATITRNQPTTDVRIQAILDYLLADVSAPLDIAHLARHIALSPSRLSHLFRAEMGQTIGQFITHLRLRHATRLMEHTPLSLSEIAAQIGFQSPLYFSRIFHRYFGMSPRDYRAQRRHGAIE